MPFLSAPPCGGRQVRLGKSISALSVSIRAPVRGRLPGKLIGLAKSMFLSAPPCGGRLACSGVRNSPLSVSIRAPVRGATTELGLGQYRFHGFYPRPVRGATVNLRCLELAGTFLSAPPCGGRHLHSTMTRHFHGVSIRAPVRGATNPFPAGSEAIFRFYPRPRAGGDASSLAV